MTPGAHTCLALGGPFALDGSPWDISTSNDINDFVVGCIIVYHADVVLHEALQKAVFGLVPAGIVVIIAHDFAVSVIGNQIAEGLAMVWVAEHVIDGMGGGIGIVGGLRHGDFGWRLVITFVLGLECCK